MELQSILTPLAGLLGTIIGIFLNKILNRKKDAVEYQGQIIEDLWQEIGRIKQSFELREKELLSRINDLENDNKKQAEEIKELRRQLNEKPDRNV